MAIEILPHEIRRVDRSVRERLWPVHAHKSIPRMVATIQCAIQSKIPLSCSGGSDAAEPIVELPHKTYELHSLQLSVHNIMLAVAIHYGLSILEIRARRRAKSICMARHMIFFLCRGLLIDRFGATISYPQIGRAAGGFDHTSVIHGDRKIRSMLGNGDTKLASDVKAITELLIIPGHKMPLVIIESPYAGEIERNVSYARAAVRDSLMRGEAPIASHLLYTQQGILCDEVSGERLRGIAAGHAWRRVCDFAAFYVDHGYSRGMIEAKALYEKDWIAIEERWL